MEFTMNERRYFTHIAHDGAFIVSDRKRCEDKRWSPTDFVYGQRGYDSRVEKYPAYVHTELWNAHDRRKRDEMAEHLHKSTRVPTLGQHITLAGPLHITENCAVENVVIHGKRQ